MLTETQKADWLAAKTSYLGASEAPTLFGENPWDTPLALWGRKTGRIPPKPQTKQMRAGDLLEPVTAALYCEETGRQIYTDILEPGPSDPVRVHRFGNTAMYSLTDCPLSCTPDRLIAPILWRNAMQLGTCQLKTTSPWLAHEWEEVDGVVTIPLRAQMQVQAEMAVIGCKWGSAAVLIGGCDFRYGDMERNDKFIETLKAKAEQFMWHVKHDKPPAELTPADKDTLCELFPHEVPGKVIQLPEEAAKLTERYEYAKAAVDHNKAIVDHCKAQLQAMLGEAEKGILPDGSAWTWKARAEYSVKAHTVAASRILRKVKK